MTSRVRRADFSATFTRTFTALPLVNNVVCGAERRLPAWMVRCRFRAFVEEISTRGVSKLSDVKAAHELSPLVHCP